MSLTQALDAFAAHQRAQGRSEHTIAIYTHDLQQVFTPLNDSALAGLTAAWLHTRLVDPAITHLADGSPKSPATVNRGRAAIRAFCAWAVRIGHLTSNPAANIHLQRAPRAMPTFLTDTDVRRLLKCLTGRTGDLARRDRVIIETFLGTGIRLQELVSLDLDDVDLDAKHLHIRRAKGGQPQVKFLNTHLRGLLRGYLAWRKKQGTDQCPALFISRQDSRLSARQVEARFAYWLAEAGIAKAISPHGLRHTFATRLYSRTGDLLVVQRALGHRSIATTEIYTHLVDGALEEALERL
jgi:integrase/recombinase XerC